MPKIPEGSFAKKLYSLYLTYLPTDKFKYSLNMNIDERGSFKELVRELLVIDAQFVIKGERKVIDK